VTSTKRPGWSARYYRCNTQSGSPRPGFERRCGGKLIPAQELEDLVWRDCRAFVLNPGDALAEAQRQLRGRMAETARLEPQRRALLQQVAEKEQERERVLTLFRRNRITLEEAERQLDQLQQEQVAGRQMLAGLRSEEELAQAFEAHLADATAMLGQLGERLAEIEQDGDGATRRQLLELLVTRLTVRTEGVGHRKRATVRAEYAFGAPGDHAVNSRRATPRGRRDRAGPAGPRSRGGS
jgi:site-specific DNA recombinase